MDPLEVLQKMFEDPDITQEERERKRLISEMFDRHGLAMKLATDWAIRNERNLEQLPEALEDSFYIFRDFIERRKAEAEDTQRRITEEKSQ